MFSGIGHGPLSLCTGALAGFTEYTLASKPEDGKVGAALKWTAIKAVNVLHHIAQFIEKVVGYIIRGAKTVVNSEKFQQVKTVVIDKATIAKDFIVEKASKFRAAISTLEQPPKAPATDVPVVTEAPKAADAQVEPVVAKDAPVTDANKA